MTLMALFPLAFCAFFLLHKIKIMDAIFLTTLSVGELQNLITNSIKSIIDSKREPEQEDTLLDTKEAAALLKYEVSSIYGLIQRQKIPFSKCEGKILFSKKELLQPSFESTQKPHQDRHVHYLFFQWDLLHNPLQK